MFDPLDLLIVGAGPVGCVIAERAATQLGWTCLIVEKRDHLAGNCFDRFHESGLLVHQYGPHYFRTDKQPLLDYLSAFTTWIPGNYVVKSQVRGQLLPFPINITTLEMFFGRTLDERGAEALLESLRERIEGPKNSEEFVLSRVGRELYEAFYLGYTLKQWERHPRDLDPSVCGRIPVRLNRDERYVDAPFQVTPADGFTAMFRRMISQPKIHLLLRTDYNELRSAVRPRFATVYCGPLDEYFDRREGALPWRSLRFEFRPVDQEFVQPCVQINYPDTHDYTRTVEIKHVTGQKHPRTVVCYEYSQGTGDPYYPVPAPESRALFQRYAEMAEAETRRNRVYFAGRLARYRYMNTDEAVALALETFEQIRRDVASSQAHGVHSGRR